MDGDVFIDEKRDPIDVVYTWVDGSDPEHLKLRQIFGDPLDWTHSDPSRFRDNGELRYSIRSVLQNMAWIRNIIIVTNGTKPSYIDDSHARIRFVDHAAVYGSLGDLPTFNSMSIECHLHKIDGLSENFIYFNDDLFVGRSLCLSDFSGPSGNGRFIFENRLLNQGEVIENDLIAYYLASTDMALNRIYGKQIRYGLSHVANLFVKSRCREVSAIWRRELSQTSSHRVRNKSDVIFAILYAYHFIYEKFPRTNISDVISLDTAYAKLADEDTCVCIPFGDKELDFRNEMTKAVTRLPKFLSLQDHARQDDLQRELYSYMLKLYPHGSEIEK